MKVGYVLRKYPKLSETFVLNEMLELERQGHEVYVYSVRLPDDPRYHPGVGALQAPVRYLGQSGDVDLFRAMAEGGSMLDEREEEFLGVWRYFMEAPHPKALAWTRWALEVAADARANGVDRLHAHFAGPAAMVAMLASRLAGIPFGFTCHAKDIYHHEVERDRFVDLVEEADAVITVCDSNRRFIEDELLGRPANNLHTVYNGIDLEHFATLPVLRAGFERPMVLGVGRLVEKKGFDVLIDAMKILQDTGRALPCVIAGDGTMRAELQTRIAEGGLQSVELAGPVDQVGVRELFERSSMLVLPCVVGQDGNRDALPTVILEAMAMRKPVVSTPVAGIPEMVRDGIEGLIVPERDASALAEAIASLAADRERAARMGDAGRERVEEMFDLRRSVATLAGVWEGSPAAVAAVS